MHDTQMTSSSQGPIQVAPTNRKAQLYLTYAELSERTGLSLSTLRRRVKDGTLRCCQPGGARTRVVFPVDVLERLSSASQTADPAPLEPEKAIAKLGPRPKWQRNPQV